MPTPLEASLDRAVSHIRLGHAQRAAAVGAMAAAAAIVIARALGASDVVAWLACPVGGALVAWLRFAWRRHTRTAAAAAAAFERADPSLRNLVVTAQELLANRNATAPYMRERVIAEAGRRVAALDVHKVVPLWPDIGAAVSVLAILAIALALPVPTLIGDREMSQFPNSHISTSQDGFTIDLSAPAYTGRPAVHLRNPLSVEALAGSHAVIHVPAGGRALVRVNGAELPVTREGLARTVLDQSGYLAIDAGAVHRLLPLSVTPDRAPDVRITAPAKDLRVATTSVSIPISAEAADDLALHSFDLRYTVVSGTGERFSFTEGTMPARVTRGSEQAWRIEASLSPAQLKLEPGDALIYRAVAADRRPGESAVASSDTFFVEIAGPGDVALAGVEMPPDKERYALSEAMIVLKIERLMAREKGMARPALEEAAATIAAEQRAVRANFIFLLGGEIEDETVEAETSSEIAEGRFANTARQEIVAATVLMGRVERGLTALSTKDARAFARDAVRALQRAFGHSRYLLRALPSRARLDPARRMSGDLASAEDWHRALAPAAPDPQADAARSALMDVIGVARALGDPSAQVDAGTRLSRLAERILALASGAGDLQAAALGADALGHRSLGEGGLATAARDLVAARDALANGDIAAARTALQKASVPLVAVAERGRIDGSPVAPAPARLAGAAAIDLRTRRGGS